MQNSISDLCSHISLLSSGTCLDSWMLSCNCSAILYKEPGSKAWLWDIGALVDLLWEKNNYILCHSLGKEQVFAFFFFFSLVHLKETHQVSCQNTPASYYP